MAENRLSHTDPIFHLVAPASSPLWGSAEELRQWIRQWHENGCPTANNPPSQKRIDRLAEIEAREKRRRELNNIHNKHRAELRKKSKLEKEQI